MALAAAIRALPPSAFDFVRLACGSTPKRGLPAHRSRTKSEVVVEIVVRYDGADLAEVAAMTGLAPAEVVRAHTSTLWRVAFAASSRASATSSAAIHASRYPAASPRAPGCPPDRSRWPGVHRCLPAPPPAGGNIGTTDAVLWDPDRSPPRCFTPGTRVRFVDIEASR